MIWILGGALGASVIYGAMQKFEAKQKSRMLKELNIESWEKTDKILELQGLVKEYEGQILKLHSELCDSKNSNDTFKIKVDTLVSKVEDLKEQLLREEQTTDKVVQDLEQKLNVTREQLKLEDEASCKIIKDLEDEIEKERALNQTYSGYIKYILNAPRAVRRRFVNGECIDWYDENGVLRMKIKEEK